MTLLLNSKKHCANFFAKNLPLILIILIGVILRSFVVTREPWFDEATSIYAARQPFREMIRLVNLGCSGQPHLFPVFLHFLLNISHAAVWLRMVLLMLGVVSIWLTYRVGKLYFNRYVGLFAAALVACNNYFIRYSIEIRAYALWLPLFFLSLYYFKKVIEKPTPKYFAFLSISTVLGIYTHLYGVYLLLFQILFIWFCKGVKSKAFRLWFVSFAATFVFLIPLMVQTYYRFQDISVWRDGFKTDPERVGKITFFFKEYSNGYEFLFCLICLFILEFWKSFASDRKNKQSISLFLTSFIKERAGSPWMIFCVLLFFIPLFINYFIFHLSLYNHFRYLLPFMTGYYFAIGVFLDKAKYIPRKLGAILLCISMLIPGIPLTLKDSWAASIYDLKKVSDFVDQKLQPADSVVADDLFSSFQIFNYLQRPYLVITDKHQINFVYWHRYFHAITSGQFVTTADFFRKGGRVWLIHAVGKDTAIEWFYEKADLLERYKVRGFDISLYQLR